MQAAIERFRDEFSLLGVAMRPTFFQEAAQDDAVVDEAQAAREEPTTPSSPTDGLCSSGSQFRHFRSHTL